LSHFSGEPQSDDSFTISQLTFSLPQEPNTTPSIMAICGHTQVDPAPTTATDKFFKGTYAVYFSLPQPLSQYFYYTR